jgi:hypothetical protein
MRRWLPIVLAAVVGFGVASGAGAQAARKPARKAPAKAAARTTTAPADVVCPQILGQGVVTRLQFCDVMTGKTPSEGIVVRIPPHRGAAVLAFDLHNRHTYSDQEVKAGTAYASYTATVAAVAPDSSVLGRGVIQGEFRTAKDLLDRVSGGAGPRGVKAVAPVGAEHITIDVPEDVNEVSLLGEKLTVVRLEGTQTYNFNGPSRPIALISNAFVEFVPARKAPAKKVPAKKVPGR